MQKKIAIIGAGLVGLGCLRMLRDEYGFEKIDVYEKLNDIGGTWHPNNEYTELGVHFLSRHMQFFDFPFPNTIDSTELISSHQLFSYLKQYAVKKQFYKHFIFDKELIKISYNKSTKKTDLIFKNKDNKKLLVQEYDYVIYTGDYTGRELPKLPGAEKFQGEILHSFQVNEGKFRELIDKDLKITILGASKTAADFILRFQKNGYHVIWLQRINYWFARLDPYKHYLKNKKNKSITLKDIWFITRFFFGILLASINTKMTLPAWRILGIIDTYGPRHSNYNKYHHAYMSDNQLNILTEYYKEHAVIGNIADFGEKNIILDNDKTLPTDVLICCTGSSPSLPSIDFEIDGQEFNIESATVVYNGAIVPEIPNLIFTAFSPLGFGIVNGLTWGNWIANYIDNNFDENYLKANSTTYSYPYFSTMKLFDSTRNFLTLKKQSADEYIKRNELSKYQYAKWSLIDAFFKITPPQPLFFKKITKRFSEK